MSETTTTLILTSGGLRSLVATAVVLTRPTTAIALYLMDKRPTASKRLEAARHQAQHFKLQPLIESPFPIPQSASLARQQSVHGDLVALYRPQLLLIALSHAIEIQADHIIWPIQMNGGFEDAAIATEQVILTETIARLSQDQLPQIESPFLELSDRQLIQLGSQLEVPWQLAWTCMFSGEQPCRACDPCRQRQAAFDDAGIVDPTDAPTAANQHH